MPLRLCILSMIGLVTLQASASAQTMLEPRVGIEALLLNCILYDPACMKVPVAALEPPSSTADRPQDAVAEARGHSPVDPETTGSVRAR
jgi:hypothetical protein